MTYSTCSLNPLENEAVVAQLLLRSQGAANPQSQLGDLLNTPECVWGAGVRMPVHSVACIGQAGRSVRLSCKSSHGAAQLCTALHCTALHCTALQQTCSARAVQHAAYTCHTARSASLSYNIQRTSGNNVRRSRASARLARAAADYRCTPRLPDLPRDIRMVRFYSEYSQIYR
jgi:hypothetical protein